MKLFRSKKAVSPLIATVLLIAFAVALGAVVMSWGREYIEETQETVEIKAAQASTCMDVSIKAKYDIGEKPCYDIEDKKLYLVIDNNGAEITGLKISIFGSEGINNSEYIKTIKEGDSVLVDVGYAGANPADVEIEQVKLVPRIKIGGEDSYCTGRDIEIENIRSISECH